MAKRVLRRVGITLLALELLYLLLGNLALTTGLVRHFANARPEKLLLDYDYAFTLWPGHLFVKNFDLRYQNWGVGIEVGIDEAHARISLSGIVQHKVHFSHVRGKGVSYRMVGRVTSAAGKEERLDAFPRLEGFAHPPLHTAQRPPPKTPEQIKRLWGVQLDDIDATVREIWICEYRYFGSGHAHGSFRLQPLTELEVTDAVIDLEPGRLTVGPHEVSRRARVHVEADMPATKIPRPRPKPEMLAGLSGLVQVDAPISISFARIYRPGLRTRGFGKLEVDAGITRGRLTPQSKLQLSVSKVHARLKSGGFDGNLNVRFDAVKAPRLRAAVEGKVEVPLPDESALEVAVPDASGEVVLTSADLAHAIGIDSAHAEAPQLRADDVRPAMSAYSNKVPWLVRGLLGPGPLEAKLSADVVPGEIRVRADRIKLGAADISGEAIRWSHQWNLSARGNVGGFPLSIKMENGSTKVIPFLKSPLFKRAFGRRP
jgi:hypothetical protein